jgi:pyruvate,orthophosphate dikinase
MGKCCVAGCSEARVDEETKTVSFESGATFKEGDVISIDGSTGFIYGEAINTVEPDVSGDFATLMGWADEIRTLKVRANADNPRDAKQAVEFGCEGIGLCRTEHMFFEEERIPAIRRMIVAETAEERKAALDIIRPFQQGDFREMYKVLGEMPMTVRLLDPPLHEFLPHTEEEIRDLAKTMNISYERLQGTVDELHELNPMLGTRGCRLAVLYPEIAEMQTEAIIGAAIEVKKECGFNIVPEIMIPLVGEARELTFVKEKVVETADRMIEEAGIEMKYMVGTMIEIPRAALTADEIAKDAEFFSFGTNDLTQMTLGFSRDDTGKLLEYYVDKGIYEEDPFKTIDVDGVGKLVEMAVKLGKQTRPNIKLGICGEHGGDPKSIDFCHRVGLTYVSCSPFRVPIARLAAAQAAIKNR